MKNNNCAEVIQILYHLYRKHTNTNNKHVLIKKKLNFQNIFTQ